MGAGDRRRCPRVASAQHRDARGVASGERRAPDGRLTRAPGRRRDIDKLVEEGRFREDLFYRLAVARLEIPPLRRREGDVPLLAAHFFRRIADHGDRAEAFLARHQGYDWPGNVRELQNAAARFAALGDAASLAPTRGPLRASQPPSARATRSATEDTVEGDVIQQVVAADLSFAEARARVLDAFERAYVTRVLALHDGNVTRAAAASGLARRYFHTLKSRQKR